MSGEAIPQHHHRAAQLTTQLVKELTDQWALDIDLGMQPEKQPGRTARATHRLSGNHGNLLVVARAL